MSEFNDRMMMYKEGALQAFRDACVLGTGILLDGRYVNAYEFFEPPTEEMRERAYSRLIARGMSQAGRDAHDR